MSQLVHACSEGDLVNFICPYVCSNTHWLNRLTSCWLPAVNLTSTSWLTLSVTQFLFSKLMAHFPLLQTWLICPLSMSVQVHDALVSCMGEYVVCLVVYYIGQFLVAVPVRKFYKVSFWFIVNYYTGSSIICEFICIWDCCQNLSLLWYWDTFAIFFKLIQVLIVHMVLRGVNNLISR